MAGETVNGPNITNTIASPVVKNDVSVDGGRLRIKTGTRNMLTTEMEIGDIVRLERIPANAVLHALEVMSDDLDSDATPLLTIELGLYLTDGTVVDINNYATAATTFQAATTAWVDLLHEARDIDEVGQKVFTDAAAADASAGEYDICLTVLAAAATAAAGDISWKVSYTVD